MTLNGISGPWFSKKWWAAGLLILTLGLAGCEVEDPESSNNNTPASNANAKQGSSNKPAEPEEPEMTSGQENALAAGQNYIDSMPFSKDGLIGQLSSNYGDGYSKKDAVFAANNVDANWNEEAVEAAENYLEVMPMSKSALIDQLSSNWGDKFTQAQAEYAANKVY